MYWLATIRNTLVYLLILGVAVACLAVGSAIARIVGAILLVFCATVALRTARKHFAD